jgi:3-phosphoglycerate kinase
MQPGDVLLLENLRFDIREERNSAPFARELAALGDWYVNDDFSTSHRPHASIARLPFLLPHAAGFLLRDEIRTLDRIINSPRRPLYVVIGGAKVRDKLGTILHLLRRVDGVLLGGASASTLLHAKGYTVGTSLIDESVSRAALTPLLRSKKLFLPTDVVVASDPQASDLETVGVLSIPKKKGAFDLGPETTRRYARDLSRARSLFWAGSIGYTERRRFCVATRKLARAISARRTFSVAAGGDTVRAFRELGLMKRFSYIATGGGAALAYLAGKPLPGLEALRK